MKPILPILSIDVKSPPLAPLRSFARPPKLLAIPLGALLVAPLAGHLASRLEEHLEPSLDTAPEPTAPIRPWNAGEKYPGLPPVPRFCGAKTRDGAECTFSARRGSGLCINHDPAYAAQQRANALKGAERSVTSRRTHAHLPEEHFDLSTHGGIQAVLDAVIRLEFAGRISERRSRNLIRALSLASRNLQPVMKMYGAPRQRELNTYQLVRRLFDKHIESLCAEADLHDDRRDRRPTR